MGPCTGRSSIFDIKKTLLIILDPRISSIHSSNYFVTFITSKYYHSLKMISSYSFQRLDFERKVNDALNSIERILTIERHPRLAGDVDHSYGSKFALVDVTTNAALIAYMNVFDKMGLSSSVLQSIDNTQATTLRFAASMKSKFEKEVIVDVPMDKSYEEEHKTTSTSEIFGNSESKRVSKVRFAFAMFVSFFV